jgi:hypothetical protein
VSEEKKPLNYHIKTTPNNSIFVLTDRRGEAGAWARQIPLLDLLEIEKIKIFFRPGIIELL